MFVGLLRNSVAQNSNIEGAALKHFNVLGALLGKSISEIFVCRNMLGQI